MPKNKLKYTSEGKPIFPPTQTEKDSIDEFLRIMESAAEKSLQSFSATPTKQRNPFIDGNIKYWTNSLGAIRWCLDVNSQRKVRENGKDT